MHKVNPVKHGRIIVV